MPGYSGTPLAKKLGFAPPLRIVLLGAPPEYRSWLPDLPSGVSFIGAAQPPVAAVHLFVSTSSELKKRLMVLRRQLAPDGFVWVSWPKKASRMPTDVTEDVIRAAALPLGFVDVKVCAVSDVWSGLKLVIRKELR